jgi:D-sedoheptulose 7-phosphate isomerase
MATTTNPLPAPDFHPELSALCERLPGLHPIAADIRHAFVLMRDSLHAGGKLLLCGNGGSAADADHWAGELLKGFRSLRPLTPDQRATLPPSIAGRLQGAIPAIPLHNFPAYSTAFGNDVDPVLSYAQLVWGLGRPGDVLVGLSTSGNAANVHAAARVAASRGLRVIGLTGRAGGKLASVCDICLRAPASETYRVQEYHLPIYHCLSLMLEEEFFG